MVDQFLRKALRDNRTEANAAHVLASTLAMARVRLEVAGPILPMEPPDAACPPAPLPARTDFEKHQYRYFETMAEATGEQNPT